MDNVPLRGSSVGAASVAGASAPDASVTASGTVVASGAVVPHAVSNKDIAISMDNRLNFWFFIVVLLLFYNNAYSISMIKNI
jgi:hypothetical protein